MSSITGLTAVLTLTTLVLCGLYFLRVLHPGAISYAFFYALGLWMIGWLLQLVRHTTWRRRLLSFIPVLILAPIVGGSNYSIALVAVMLLFLLVIS